jgi:hypothetical protein
VVSVIAPSDKIASIHVKAVVRNAAREETLETPDMAIYMGLA